MSATPFAEVLASLTRQRGVLGSMVVSEADGIIVETEVATIALAPGPRAGLLLVAADGAMPLGMVRRFLDRAAARARSFVEGIA